MEFALWKLIIICPLIFLASFVDAIAGGGGVISLPAYLLAGMPMKLAAGTNKVAAGCGSALASYKYARSGNVEWLCALPAAVFSLIGASIGASLAVYMREDILQGIVLISLPIVAVFLFFSRKKKSQEAPVKIYRKSATVAISSVIGFAVGCYDGLVGPGTGTFLTLGFSAALSYSLLRSAGCARIANFASNAASIVVYLLNGKVVFLVAIPAMVCSLLGSNFGSKFAIKGGSQKIRYVMFVVLGLLFLKIGLNFLGIIDF